jgi:YD repeat-containing protein
MRVSAGLRFLLISLAFVLPCTAEDRTERIDGSKGWKELDYRGDSLVEERTFEATGALLAERSFSPEALAIVTKRYVREGGRLVKVEASDASGNTIGTMNYHYDREGRLLQASSDGIFGAESVGMISSEGSPQGSWIESESATKVYAYDDAGRAVLLQSLKDGKVARIERRAYGNEGILSSVTIDDKLAENSWTSSYDTTGRESERKAVDAKGEEVLTRFSYDASGRLIEELKIAGGHELAIRRSYSVDGALIRAETRRDKSLVLAVEYAGESRTEELYEDGELFVKATYRGGRKVKDEFFTDGKLKRSRDYQ